MTLTSDIAVSQKTKIPGLLRYHAAELAPSGAVTICGKALRSDHSATHRNVQYHYQHAERRLEVSPKSDDGINVVCEFTDNAWWLSDPTGEFASPWLFDWTAKLGLLAWWRSVPLSDLKDGTSAVVYHDIGPLRLTREGCVFVGSRHAFEGAFDEFRYEDISLRRGGPPNNMLEIIDHNGGDCLFYAYLDDGVFGSWCPANQRWFQLIVVDYTEQKQTLWERMGSMGSRKKLWDRIGSWLGRLPAGRQTPKAKNV